MSGALPLSPVATAPSAYQSYTGPPQSSFAENAVAVGNSLANVISAVQKQSYYTGSSQSIFTDFPTQPVGLQVSGLPYFGQLPVQSLSLSPIWVLVGLGIVLLLILRR